MVIQDALGRTIRLKKPPETVVSLIPSITETLFAYGLDREIVAVTDYCIHPEEKVQGKPGIGGPKSIQCEKILSLAPDLVIANYEENDKDQVETLISGGLQVFVSYPRAVDDALTLMLELGWILGKIVAASDLVEEIKDTIMAMKAPEKRPGVLCPIWKNPYMSFNGWTFCSNLIELCGGENIFTDRKDSYFEFTLEEAKSREPDVVLLPTEPYAFTAEDGEEFRQAGVVSPEKGKIRVVEGELITWFGVRMKKALETVPALLK